MTAGSKKAPRLSEVGSRVNPAYIEAFIRDPHGTKPGTTMPDVLAQLEGEEKQQVATTDHALPRIAEEERLCLAATLCGGGAAREAAIPFAGMRTVSFAP
jgi:hypothetical protein